MHHERTMCMRWPFATVDLYIKSPRTSCSSCCSRLSSPFSPSSESFARWFLFSLLSTSSSSHAWYEENQIYLACAWREAHFLRLFSIAIESKCVGYYITYVCVCGGWGGLKHTSNHILAHKNFRRRFFLLQIHFNELKQKKVEKTNAKNGFNGSSPHINGWPVPLMSL